MPTKTAAKTAAKTKQDDVPLDIQAPMDIRAVIEAAETEGVKPSFVINAYSGGVMQLPHHPIPVVADLAGGSVRNQSIPVLLDHRKTADGVIGQTTRVDITAEGIIVAGDITGDVDNPGSAAHTVATHARRGFTWQSSIGARIIARESVPRGTTERVNGRDVEGPALIARQWELYEVSIVSMGADHTTSASIAAQAGEEEEGQQEEQEAAEGNAGIKSISKDPASQAHTTSEQTMPNTKAKSQGGTGDTGAHTTTESKVEIQASAGNAAADLQTTAVQPDIQASLAANRKQYADEARRVSGINTIVASYGTDYGIDDKGEKIENLAVHAIEAGLSPQDTELLALRAERSRAPAGHVSRPQAGDAQVIEAAISLTTGLPEELVASTIPASERERVMEAALSKNFRGMSLHGLMSATIQAAGRSYHGQYRSDDFIEAAFQANNIIQAAHGTTTYSLTGVLSNIANKTLLNSFQTVNSTLDKVARVVSHNDFKEGKSFGWVIGGIEEIGRSGDVPHAKVTEMGTTNSVKQHGAQLAVTRPDLINDDLGAFTRAGTALGRAAARSKEKIGWKVFTDGVATQFTTDNGNTIVGSLDVAGLGAAEAAMLNIEVAGEKALITPSALLVPPALGPIARQLYTSSTVNETTTANKARGVDNPYRESFEPVISPYLASATTFYLLGSPLDAAVVEIAYLNGRRTPQVTQGQMEIGRLGVVWQVVFDFGVALGDHFAAIQVTAS